MDRRAREERQALSWTFFHMTTRRTCRRSYCLMPTRDRFCTNYCILYIQDTICCLKVKAKKSKFHPRTEHEGGGDYK